MTTEVKETQTPDVEPNTTPIVRATHPALLTDGKYAVSYEKTYEVNGKTIKGTYFESKSSIAYDVESTAKRLANDGQANIRYWKKRDNKTYEEDSSWLKSEKKVVVGKLVDRELATMFRNLSATFREAASLVTSGEYNDDVEKELRDACSAVFQRKHR
jgi:hypothetical protein